MLFHFMLYGENVLKHYRYRYCRCRCRCRSRRHRPEFPTEE